MSRAIVIGSEMHETENSAFRQGNLVCAVCAYPVGTFWDERSLCPVEIWNIRSRGKEKLTIGVDFDGNPLVLRYSLGLEK